MNGPQIPLGWMKHAQELLGAMHDTYEDASDTHMKVRT
jgi:hypothetical protein